MLRTKPGLAAVVAGAKALSVCEDANDGDDGDDDGNDDEVVAESAVQDVAKAVAERTGCSASGLD